MLSQDESQSVPHHLDVNTSNANGILMDSSGRPYLMSGQESSDCMHEGLPGKCFLQQSHQEGHWSDTYGFSDGNPGERLSQEVNVVEVNSEFLSRNQESSVSMDVDAENSLRETQITVQMIQCMWCKRKRPCGEFEKYL